jgi:hypothetical protein
MKEYWSGDSRDGVLINGDGYHYFRMVEEERIVEAFELYETDDGEEIVTPLPEMVNISWTKDLGFEDLDILDKISREEFQRIKELHFGY